MTKEEIVRMVGELKRVFDIVRLVDVNVNSQFSFDDEGNLLEEPYLCYAVWKKDQRCENCISAKAFSRRNQMTKFEFVDNEVYYVVSKYVEVEGVPYMMEMVSKVTDETLFGAYGKNDFVETISAYSRKIYVDSLTGAYNRHYYEEQILGLRGNVGFAMIDVDNFKGINDTWGHHAGDLALKAIADTVRGCVRNTDMLVRYGGDEFVLVLPDIPKDIFKEKLERIREAISDISVEDYPGIHLSVSIGGKYNTNPKRSVEDIVKLADRSLYEAKIQKNHVCCCD